MTIGSDTEISVGSNGWAHTGSGVFVGSGGYMSTGLETGLPLLVVWVPVIWICPLRGRRHS